jgi:hypothetical protein
LYDLDAAASAGGNMMWFVSKNETTAMLNE